MCSQFVLDVYISVENDDLNKPQQRGREAMKTFVESLVDDVMSGHPATALRVLSIFAGRPRKQFEDAGPQMKQKIKFLRSVVDEIWGGETPSTEKELDAFRREYERQTHGVEEIKKKVFKTPRAEKANSITNLRTLRWKNAKSSKQYRALQQRDKEIDHLDSTIRAESKWNAFQQYAKTSGTGSQEPGNETASQISEGNSPSFESLKKNKVPLSEEERKKVWKAGALWSDIKSNVDPNTGEKKKKKSAIWKSEIGDQTWYGSNTHRLFRSAKTLEGAIKDFKDHVIKTR